MADVADPSIASGKSRHPHEQRSYLAEQAQSLAVAHRWIDSLEEKLKFLADQPLAGEARPDLAEAVRAFPVGDHVVFYRPSERGIEVLRVLRGRRDIPRIFRTGEN